MSTHDTILSLLAERDAARAKLADCERRERAAVERADALRLMVQFHAELQGCDRCAQAITADDQHRSAQGTDA